MSFTVHLMKQGKPLCGDEMARTGVYSDFKQVTCQACRQAYLKQDISTVEVTTPPPEPNAKRQPAYTDDDKMPFGKHKNELLSDVPATYFHWLWQQRPLSNQRLENYIFNSIPALKKDYPDGIWT